jgi:hypothetical protein
MNSKILHQLFGILLIVTASNAQVITLPVGESYFLSHWSNRSWGASCRYGVDTCFFWRISAVNKIEIGAIPYSNCPFYNHSSDFYFSAPIPLSFDDTVTHYIGLAYVSGPCMGAGCPNSSFDVHYQFKTYYDSCVRVNTYGADTLQFYVGNGQYLTTKNIMRIFNNYGDSLWCDSVRLAIDPSTQLVFGLEVEWLQMATFAVEPLSQRLLQFTFSSGASIFKQPASFNATLNFYLRFAQKDTVVTVPLYFIFEWQPDISVPSFPAQGIASLTSASFPNNRTQITLDLVAPQNILLEVFDVLGRRIDLIAKGFFEAGKYEFDVKTPPGLLFVRLQTLETTRTVKIFSSFSP